jgi:hypothetical protein
MAKRLKTSPRIQMFVQLIFDRHGHVDVFSTGMQHRRAVVFMRENTNLIERQTATRTVLRVNQVRCFTGNRRRQWIDIDRLMSAFVVRAGRPIIIEVNRLSADGHTRHVRFDRFIVIGQSEASDMLTRDVHRSTEYVP